MCHELLGCMPQYSLRFLKKNCCIVLLSLPIATLICILLFSPQASLKATIFKAENGALHKTYPLSENSPQTKEQSDIKSQNKILGENIVAQGANLFTRSVPEIKEQNDFKIEKEFLQENGVPQIQAAPLVLNLESSLKNYTIHVWNHGERMKRRFLRSYGSFEKDPFEFCSVSNCVLTVDDSKVAESDAVLFHLHRTKGPHTLPRFHPPKQIWIFFTDESPLHTFLADRKYSMKDYDGLFNWSMTYRSDSDVPVPYGRTVPLSKHEISFYKPIDYAKTKTHSIAILGSNCGGQNHRWDYVHELQKHVNVDIYGGCGTLKCPGHFTKDCPTISDYKFYLAFENSNCNEYITEKLWWNAYYKKTVPVVMGAPKLDYEKFCPPDSFIHVSDFQSPEDLAKYITFLLNNDTAYNSYFEWKKKYKVLNEHGYFGSPSLHMCRMCEALNRISTTPKIYTDLGSFWNPKSDCHRANWKPGL